MAIPVEYSLESVNLLVSYMVLIALECSIIYVMDNLM